MYPALQKHMVPVIEGTGDAYPGNRTDAASRPEQTGLDAATAFRADQERQDANNAEDTGGPYAVKGAAHPHDRMEERTPLHRSHVELIQGAVDMLRLPKQQYHLPLRGKDGSVMGYAQFRGVENRDHPVLVTILGPQMRPSGENISSMLYKSARVVSPAPGSDAYLFDTDENRARNPPMSLTPGGDSYWSGRQAPVERAVREAFGQVDVPTTNGMEESRSP